MNLVQLMTAGALATGLTCAQAATITHVASYKASGGDASYGNGDTTTNTALYGGFLPLFDSSLGTLQKVSIEMEGWRSVSFSCTTVHSTGGCNARASGSFTLRADSYNPYQFPTLATVFADAPNAISLAPQVGETLSAVSYAEASTFDEITDPALLAVHFDGAGKDPNWTYFTWYFSAWDGGAFGFGGGAGITSLYWDADSTIKLTYHYASPVPLPAAGALMMSGLGVLGLINHRRRAGRTPQ